MAKGQGIILLGLPAAPLSPAILSLILMATVKAKNLRNPFEIPPVPRYSSPKRHTAMPGNLYACQLRAGFIKTELSHLWLEIGPAPHSQGLGSIPLHPSPPPGPRPALGTGQGGGGASLLPPAASLPQRLPLLPQCQPASQPQMKIWRRCLSLTTQSVCIYGNNLALRTPATHQEKPPSQCDQSRPGFIKGGQRSDGPARPKTPRDAALSMHN